MRGGHCNTILPLAGQRHGVLEQDLSLERYFDPFAMRDLRVTDTANIW